MSVTEQTTQPCTVERGMQLIGGEWKASILWYLAEQPMTQQELMLKISTATKIKLGRSLKELTQDGLIARQDLKTNPKAYRYDLTPLGSSTLGILDQLRIWTEYQGF